MYTNRSYNIDDIVRYSSNTKYSNNLNYFISRSENYTNAMENNNNQIEYNNQQQRPIIYSRNNYLSNEDKPTRTYYFTPKIFLKPIRPLTQFVDTTEQVIEFVDETFRVMFRKNLPKNR